MKTRKPKRWTWVAAWPVIGAALPALAQGDAATTLEPVVVTAEREQRSAFDTPAAIGSIDASVLERAGPLVNLSEAMNRLPGIVALNRQNYAQDLQLSIRGFGARSTFGIRGVRLIVDGIPATMPDGQGQASNIALGSTGRIEVLRGPLAQLYGNSAGGVVQVFTQDDAAPPEAEASIAAGPYGLRRIGAGFSGRSGDQGLTLDASHFETDGYRAHSDARRDLLNARWQTHAEDTDLRIVLNVLDQPKARDPGGLTRAEMDADPRQAAPLAVSQDARKVVRQQQVGGVIDHEFSPDTKLTARLYAGHRSLDNALSVPPAAQAAPTSSGGMVALERDYAGFGAQVSHHQRLGEQTLRWVAGLEGDRMDEDRKGYVNNAGQQGALKRDEDNRVGNLDLFAQASLDLSPDWNLIAGVRSSRVRFRSEDHFIAAGNPDDSGGVDYRATNPVFGVGWFATPDLHVYANLGRGFETPTFTELAYRSGGLTGLNTDLKASRSRHFEFGAKWKAAPRHRVEAALFDIATEDEIVVQSNTGGRSVFQNAGRTRRNGAELSWLADWGAQWQSTVSATLLHARFSDAFETRGVTVPAGTRLPGTPQRSGFAELAWKPAQAWAGFNAGVEWSYIGSLRVDDTSTEEAPSAHVFNLRGGFVQQAGGWRFTQLLRLDNLFDRRYAGSVIVNDANGRYYEPALPRTWMISAAAQYVF
jgi:iron complex outermembrane receptor protein